jgi:hypothetical protein
MRPIKHFAFTLSFPVMVENLSEIPSFLLVAGQTGKAQYSFHGVRVLPTPYTRCTAAKIFSGLTLRSLTPIAGTRSGPDGAIYPLTEGRGSVLGNNMP